MQQCPAYFVCKFCRLFVQVIFGQFSETAKAIHMQLGTNMQTVDVRLLTQAEPIQSTHRLAGYKEISTSP